MEKPDMASLLEHLNSGKPVNAGTPLHATMVYYSIEARRITALINSSWHGEDDLRVLMAQLTGMPIDENFRLFPPIYTDFGKNIHIGKTVFINSCCCFQDHGGIYIGDGALIGHNVVFATINHGLYPKDRATNYPSPIRIGKNVWIGASAVILPNVTIGDDAVIAAGAVVSHDVEPGAVVGGVPARLIRRVPDKFVETGNK